MCTLAKLARLASGYNRGMESSTPTPPEKPRQVAILVLEEDADNAVAVRQLLDSEGWRVAIVTDSNLLLNELRNGEWALVVANVAVTGTDSAAFTTLRELASVPADEGGRIRVLYIVPEMADIKYVQMLERARLPYVVRPFNFHDLIQKVSDLLFEVHAIAMPLRQVGREFGTVRKKKLEASRTSNSMFASRDSYSYSEEEVAEYERQEASASRRHKPRTNLGDPNG
jgi:DNA-binding response OmpR family regulator